MNWMMKNPMDLLKDLLKTPMVKLLEEIQKNVMHKLPYYNDFKLSYQGKEGRTLEKYFAELKPITEDQKKDINELIKTNKLLFGYRNDTKSIGVLTNIIEYSTFCGDPVAMAQSKSTIAYLSLKSKLQQFRDKINQIMHYFYYHPDITREIGAALEKYVDVPIRHRINPEDMFDYNYNKGDSIFFEKDGIRTVGTIQEKDKKQYQVDYIDYKDKSKIMKVTLRENDILGYGNNKGGIISWIFTDVVIDDLTEACLDPKYDGDRESKKCKQGEPLNMRNNVICTLYEGAKTANPNTQYPEIKICTECKDEEAMSGVTDPESRGSSISSTGSENLDLRDPLYGNELRPSMSSLSSDDTNMTTLTDEESQAYDTFKKAVCKASLEEKEAELKTNKAESDRALKNKDDEITELKKAKGKFSLGVKRFLGKKGGKKKSSTKKKRKNVTRRKKKYGKKSKKSRK
jgi:hypothetical protein